MTGITFIAVNVSEEAKLKLEAMYKRRDDRLKKMVGDFREGKLKINKVF